MSLIRALLPSLYCDRNERPISSLNINSSMNWLYGNVAIIMLGALLSPLFMRSIESSEDKPTLIFVLIIALFGMSGSLLSAWMRDSSMPKDLKWNTPSLRYNPFMGSEPLVQYQISAYVFISLGAGSAVVGMLETPENWMWVLPMSLGIGIWLGLKLSMVMFRKRLRTW